MIARLCTAMANDVMWCEQCREGTTTAARSSIKSASDDKLIKMDRDKTTAITGGKNTLCRQ